MDSCAGTGWWVELALENIGGTSFESMVVTLIDTATGTVLPLNAEDFTNRDGCTTSTTQTNLPAGATRIVSLPVFAYDPSGHNLQATITLCSNPGRSGLCLLEAINFTP